MVLWFIGLLRVVFRRLDFFFVLILSYLEVVLSFFRPKQFPAPTDLSLDVIRSGQQLNFSLMDFFQSRNAVNMRYSLQTHNQIKVCERFPGWKPCAYRSHTYWCPHISPVLKATREARELLEGNTLLFTRYLLIFQIYRDTRPQSKLS